MCPLILDEVNSGSVYVEALTQSLILRCPMKKKMARLLGMPLYDYLMCEISIGQKLELDLVLQYLAEIGGRGRVAASQRDGLRNFSSVLKQKLVNNQY